MMQLTGQNWFTRSLSVGYKMTKWQSRTQVILQLRMEGEVIKQSIVRESTTETRTESMSVSRMVNGNGESIRSSAILMFIYIVLFTFLAHF